jgi:hypothetical protein
MKRKFYCDVPANCNDNYILVAWSNPTAQQNLSAGCRRVEFVVDMPDECFIKVIEAKSEGVYLVPAKDEK